MRWKIVLVITTILFISSLGYAISYVDLPTITRPVPTKPIPTITRPTRTSITTVVPTISSMSDNEYNILCGYELFFWKVYSDTVFYENFVVLKEHFSCKPVKITPSTEVDSMLIDYYYLLLKGDKDVYTYLAMRDYPAVYKVNSSIPSPVFDPVLYAKYETSVEAMKNEKNNNQNFVMTFQVKQ